MTWQSLPTASVMHDTTIEESRNAAAAASAALLDEILATRALTMAYQPIVSLNDSSVIGYEALVRGPADTTLAMPDQLFATAAAAGRLHELDLACQAEAIRQAEGILGRSGHALFINIEPSTFGDRSGGRDEAVHGIATAVAEANLAHRFPIVLEMSERRPLNSPAELLELVGWARGQGFRIAIDDVGANPASLALLPLLDPDVIKLDRSLLAAEPTPDTGLVCHAVRAQAQRTGASVVCEGIETDADRELALALGATHAQGFAIGHPQPLRRAPLRIRGLDRVDDFPDAADGADALTPFQLVAGTAEVRTGRKDLLLALSMDLERQAAVVGGACILSSFQRAYQLGLPTRIRYERLAASASFVVALGRGLSPSPLPGVFGGDLADDDPIVDEWDVVVLSPHFSAALLARDLGDTDAPEADRRFDFVLTNDRSTVVRSARLMMARVLAGTGSSGPSD